MENLNKKVLYIMCMRKILLFSVFLSVVVFASCGNEKDESEQKEEPEQISFTRFDSDVIYQMGLKGNNVQPKSSIVGKPKKWENQIRILNNACGGVSSDRYHPVSIISPDGAPLGLVDDSWEPNWSPDGTRIAFACGRDDDNNVVVVSETEHSGISENWSRTGSGSLSDRMEIYVVKPDGTEIIELTKNQSGDWLPRWFPKGKHSTESEFFKNIVAPDFLLIESNRDGNSEIYVISTISTKSWRLTDNQTQDQSPAWSQKGTAAVFASNETGNFEISLNSDPLGVEIENTGVTGRPVPWEE